ncbi:MAG TPA: ATP-binding protein [Nevskia sp.]|nr:ATP-binding protein [Nevskia sp.]
MSLMHEAFDSINAASLQSLIDSGVPESFQLEYKREPYGRAAQDRKEFVKDVTAFANASGGHLVIGLDEANGVATALTPIAGDPDAEMLRMEQMLLGGVEPRAAGIRMRAIPVAGGHCIVLRIPSSWNPPHRVTIEGSNRFYVRHNTLSAEMNVEELRVLFNRGATAQERALAWRRERLALIRADQTSSPVALRPATLVLHIMPVLPRQGAVLPNYHADLNRLRPWRPLHSYHGDNARYNFDGLLTIGQGDNRAYYLQLFRNGAVEALQSGIGNVAGADRRLPAGHLERMVLEALPRILDGLNSVEIGPPYTVMMTLLCVQDLQLTGAHQGNTPFDRDSYELPPVVINELGPAHSYDPIMKAAFDALWQAAGDYQAENFDADGRWTLRR